ncbi:MAG: c-type cytochrome [Hyphococcus sp.]
MKMRILLVAAFMLGACGGEDGANKSRSVRQQNIETPSTPSERGRRAFSACAACHAVRPGAVARVGPNLYGVYGRAAGAADGFAYSSALMSSGIVWNNETLDAFIEDPDALIPGNRMSYFGEPDADTRADLIAYLRSLSADG